MERCVSQFFFSVRCPDEAPQVEHFDFPDNDAACREALQACSDLLREINGIATNCAEWEMEVTREDGSQIAVLRFTMRGFSTAGRRDG